MGVPTIPIERNANSSLSEEVPLNWNKGVRQIHRWLSIAFTVTIIIVTIVVLGQEEPTEGVFFLPLLPLALLLFTGLYLFVLPYATKWRSGRPDRRCSPISPTSNYATKPLVAESTGLRYESCDADESIIEG